MAKYDNNLVVSQNVDISPYGNERGVTFTFGSLNPANEGLVSTPSWKTVGIGFDGVSSFLRGHLGIKVLLDTRAKGTEI